MKPIFYAAILSVLFSVHTASSGQCNIEVGTSLLFSGYSTLTENPNIPANDKLWLGYEVHLAGNFRSDKRLNFTVGMSGANQYVDLLYFNVYALWIDQNGEVHADGTYSKRSAEMLYVSPYLGFNFSFMRSKTVTASLQMSINSSFLLYSSDPNYTYPGPYLVFPQHVLNVAASVNIEKKFQGGNRAGVRFPSYLQALTPNYLFHAQSSWWGVTKQYNHSFGIGLYMKFRDWKPGINN